jgi:anhydro-N-acetylmuramic acid kinase
MVYHVIGLMSGSSLDGLDIAYVHLEEVRGKWAYEIVEAACIPYNEEWGNSLMHAADLSVSDFLRLDTAYGRYLGERVNEFIHQHELDRKVHFVASHGHTVYHEPRRRTTFQIGDGATIAVVTGLPVISDLRAMDVASGGKGAPIVPIGDRLLWGDYNYLVNIGGIANITVLRNGETIAFDICPANQILNTLAQREGKDMDRDGSMAAQGQLLIDVLAELNEADYYALPPPKSLSNLMARDLVFPVMMKSEHNTYDLLHTMVRHIAEQIALATSKYNPGNAPSKMLVTGGGAFNSFLIAQLQKSLRPYSVAVTVPDATVVKYKEALVIALVGALRWREETNVLSSVTGAAKDTIGGALWMV